MIRKLRTVHWAHLWLWVVLTTCGTLGFVIKKTPDDEVAQLTALLSQIPPNVLLSFGVLAGAGLWLSRRAGFTLVTVELTSGLRNLWMVPQFMLALLLGLVIGLGNFAVEVLTADAVSAVGEIAKPGVMTVMARNILYDSITEEVLFRLLLMSLIVYAGMRLFPRAAHQRDDLLLVLAVVLSSLACAANALIDLPAMADLSFAVGSTVLLTELVIGVILGVIYWRIGFEAAVAAHVCAYLIITLPLVIARSADLF